MSPIKSLSPRSSTPQRKHPTDASLDLGTIDEITIPPVTIRDEGGFGSTGK
ncbi:hypothetical protein [Corynebacterium diphtheriae]|uniref:hypothetical protein n=1 Tax=Corynebacterium diphtheriae TaxID=1717 RepID=UPI000A53770D|nr:hypothetical protein [Corynebacterium diphtheriae]